MTQAGRRSKMAALILAVAIPGAGLVGASPAGAEGNFFYATTTESRTFEFSVRMFSAAELHDWLRAAGFRETRAYGEDGEPLTLEHRRMAVVGRK